MYKKKVILFMMLFVMASFVFSQTNSQQSQPDPILYRLKKLEESIAKLEQEKKKLEESVAKLEQENKALKERIWFDGSNMYIFSPQNPNGGSLYLGCNGETLLQLRSVRQENGSKFYDILIAKSNLGIVFLFNGDFYKISLSGLQPSVTKIQN